MIQINVLARDYNGSWDEPKGYVSIKTTVSIQDRTSSGNPIFKVKADIDVHKNFASNKTDYLIIRHDNNGVYSDKFESNKKGYGMYKRDSTGISRDTSRYSDIGFGTYYSFKNQITSPDLGIFSWFHLRYVNGYHFFTATNDTSVQVAYVHDQKVFGNVSIGFGPVSIGMDISGSKIYAATPVSIDYQ